MGMASKLADGDDRRAIDRSRRIDCPYLNRWGSWRHDSLHPTGCRDGTACRPVAASRVVHNVAGRTGRSGSTLREYGGSRAAGAGVPRARGSRRGSAGNGRRSPAVRRRVGTPARLCPGSGARRDHRDIPARGADPGPGVAGSRVAGGLRAGVRVHGQEEERDAPGPPGGLCAVERGEPGVDRRAASRSPARR